MSLATLIWTTKTLEKEKKVSDEDEAGIPLLSKDENDGSAHVLWCLTLPTAQRHSQLTGCMQ